MKRKESLLLLSLFLILSGYIRGQQENYLHGVAAASQKDYKSAIDLFSEGLKSNETKPLCFLARGKAFSQLGKIDEAIKDFMDAEKLKPGIASYELAKCYAKQGNIENTVYYMRLHLESPYKVSESEIKKEEVFNNVEKFKDWKNLWQTEWYTKSEKISADANYLVSSGDNLEAVELINKELLHFPRAHELYVARARAFVALGNQRSSLDDYNTALSLTKRNAEYYKERGILLASVGKDKKAADDFTQALKIKPEMFDLYLLRAEACKRTEDFKQAIKDVELYLQFYPKSEEAMFTAGQIYYDYGEYDTSIKKLSPLIEKNPSKPEYYHARGLAYFEIRELDAAIHDFSQALDLNPDLPETWYNKALARYYNGDKEGACLDWKKAKELGNTSSNDYLGTYCK
jgi:tetratricopeptide (TPR) repeat protein